MPELNTIYDNSKAIVGTFRHGVAWSRPDKKRIGEYDESFVYDNNTEVLGKISGNVVVDIMGNTIGYISGNDLYVSDEKVGSFIGSTSAGCAAIVLLFSCYTK
ncbi:MAG: hypothetical protein V3U87_10245 [Methylococcaceae bacterium]